MVGLISKRAHATFINLSTPRCKSMLQEQKIAEITVQKTTFAVQNS